MKYLIIIFLIIFTSCTNTVDVEYNYFAKIRYFDGYGLIVSEIDTNSSIEVKFDYHSEFNGVYKWNEHPLDMTWYGNKIINEGFDSSFPEENIVIKF